MRNVCRILLIVVTLLPMLPPTLLARTPDDLADIQREAQIVADVMKSALRRASGERLRITAVEPLYLADQGVLLTVIVNTPWINLQNGNQSLQFNGRLAIPEIPAMVENILNDLQINVAPYEPEALEDLRDLRSEQRDLRSEQRKLRSDLRKERRNSVREDEAHKRAEINTEIASLEAELAELDRQYDELSMNIDQQYERLRNYRDGYGETPEAAAEPVMDMQQLIAQSACDYGINLKSLDDEDHLTIALSYSQHTQLYAFRMSHIERCSRGDMQPDQLLKASYQYEG